MFSRGVRCLIHYQDDFLLFLWRGKDILVHYMYIGNILRARDPSSISMTFLGILVDTARMELRLPLDKLQRFRAKVSNWRGKRSCTRSELDTCCGRYLAREDFPTSHVLFDG